MVRGRLPLLADQGETTVTINRAGGPEGEIPKGRERERERERDTRDMRDGRYGEEEHRSVNGQLL